MTADEIDTFWTAARHQTRTNPVPGYLGTYSGEALAPPAWAFGATPEQADELIALVLDGTKTATASAQWDYEHEGEQLPRVGDLSIVLDGSEHPRALIEVTQVEVRPFDDVDAEHALLEGEGDRSLEHWRTVHERFFTDHAGHDRGFTPAMPVVLERFRVLYPR
ncbi:ASCH domain-containing protein [Aeromicrobium sp. P5_D10]